jgi:hypothetical protein
MSAISHEPSALVRRPTWVEARDMWASLAIVSIWLAVLVTALFGPDIKTIDAAGAASTVPSAIPVALFAVFATWPVAKYGLDSKATHN